MTDAGSHRTVSGVLGIALAGLVMAGCAGTTPKLADQLTEADRVAMADARQQALEVNKSGEALNWHNPETDHRGVITPVMTYESSANENCRDFQETLTVGDQSYIDYGTACRRPDGNWERRDPHDPVRYGRHYENSYGYYGYPWGPYLYHSRRRYGHHGPYSHDHFLYNGFGFGLRL